jgi:glycosyltransferase involved in cell wall biosynthesis
MQETHLLTFPRTSNPLVSVLLPTRGRSEWLLKSIDSLLSLSYNPRNIEILFKVDEDDEPTKVLAEKLCLGAVNSGLNIKSWVSPRGNGYQEIHLWYNHLSSVATGDWLLVWNDDAVMLTEKWDYYLEFLTLDARFWHGAMDVCCLIPEMKDDPGCTAFFFLRRKVVEILGRYSAIPHCDTWVTKMMMAVDSLVHFPVIQVAHLQAHDKTFDEGQKGRETTEYTRHGHATNLERLQDSVKLQSYICEHGYLPKTAE